MLGVWDTLPVGKRTPRDPSVASLKADIRDQKKKPIEHLIRLAFSAIDAGVPVERVTLFLREMIEAAEHYAARRERAKSSGLLTFRQSFTRLAAKGCTEEGEANAATMELDENDPASLRKVRAELLEEMAVDQAKADRITARIVELEANR